MVLDAVDLASWRWGVILCLSAAIWIRKAWDDDRRNHFYSPVEDNARPYHAWSKPAISLYNAILIYDPEIDDASVTCTDYYDMCF